MSRSLDDKLEILPGVGQTRLAQLARLKLHTLGDLLLNRPRRYEDRQNASEISACVKGESILVNGVIQAHGVKRFRGGRKSVYEFVLDDGTARVHCRFWNMAFLESQLAVGRRLFVFGKVSGLKPSTMDHPEFEIVEDDDEQQLHLNRIVPVYRSTEGLPQRWLRGFMWRILSGLDFAEVPDQKLASDKFGKRRPDQLRQLHFPDSSEEAELSRRRFALEEFTALQRGFARRRNQFRKKAHGHRCTGNNRLIKPFLGALTFQLTDAQTKVLREIRADFGHTYPMRRLLHGDVGSGKTVVAACAALMVIESRFSVAFMAPTEILAEQHYRRLNEWFHPHGVGVELLTGKTRPTAGSVESAMITVGTHALIHDNYQPENLGLVIIDEQHRFGVIQREKLLRKGVYPHLLVMTATPIPRTLGLTAYGDLDVSVIDELPGGRGRIRTHLRKTDDIAKVWKFVAAEMDLGRQAYVVYPRVEEDATGGDLKSVKEEHDRLTELFAPRPVGLVHGQMDSSQAQVVVDGFRKGEIKMLVATTVIEVGVDVPNASIMVIENAGQFGLSQLHQLRGRIGRGSADSHCILIEDSRKADAIERLQVLLETNDGFRIAEEDMRLRGVGDFLGTRQSGMPKLRFGDLVRDRDLVVLARQLVDSHPA